MGERDTRQELESLLYSKLEPIRETIVKLERTQEQMVTLLMGQARQEERIAVLVKDVEKCTIVHNDLYARIRALETDGGKKVWDVLKLLATAILGGVIGILAGKG